MSAKIELPKKREELTEVGTKVRADLWSRVKEVTSKRGVTLRSAIEFGLEKFLEETKNEKS
jgi:hypothetical protein